MQYVDKGSVVPPPFNLLPSGKYFIEICKRCYDRIISQKVHKSLLFAGFVDQELDLPTGVTRGQCYQKLYNKHLMTGHKGNSEFCFPKMLNVP